MASTAVFIYANSDVTAWDHHQTNIFYDPNEYVCFAFKYFAFIIKCVASVSVFFYLAYEKLDRNRDGIDGFNLKNFYFFDTKFESN